MTFVRTAGALILGALLAAGPGARAQDKGDPDKPPNDPKAILPVRINQAIDSGVAWLKKQTYAPGNWSDQITGTILYDPNAKGPIWCNPTGCTSLSLYALLKSGVPKDDPVIVKGFKWLKTGSSNAVTGGTKIEPNEIPNGTYDIAALILALEARANPHKRDVERERELKFRLKKGEKLKTDVKLDPEDQAWMGKLVAGLMKRQNKGAAWRYGALQDDNKTWDNGPRHHNDLSASNLAMLALLAAERCGFAQKDEFYAGILRWTLTMQEKSGPEIERWDPTIKAEDKAYGLPKDHARGFGYCGATGADPENVATGSMTACGLANIVICTTILEARNSKAYTGELQAAAEKAWWDGVAWLHNFWSVTSNVGKGGYHYYYLYCLERACDLKRINLIAGHPWYNEGAQVLVDEQNPDGKGAWTKQDGKKPCDILNTCFALLFLNRATPAITGD
jgi:hypothetical protein